MLAIQNLLRRKVRTFFALLGIAVGISAVVSIVSMAKGLRGQFYKIASQFAWDAIVQERGLPSPVLSHLKKSDEKAVLATPGVKAVSPFAFYLIRRKDQEKPQPIPVLGFAPGCEVLARYQIIRGRTLQPGDTNQILLGELSARQLGLDVGGTIETTDEVGSYEVVGIFRPPVGGVDLLAGQAIINIEFLCEKFEAKPNLLIVHLKTGEEALRGARNREELKVAEDAIAAVASSLESKPKTKHLEARAFKDYLDSFKQLEIMDKFAWAMSFLAALVGGIGIANTMLMSVFERTREIGLLRAVGWSRTQICSLIVLEGLALSILGGILGVPLGWLEVLAATKMVEMGWIQASVEPGVAVQAVLLATAIGVVGSLYPGLRAANLEPTEALRYE